MLTYLRSKYTCFLSFFLTIVQRCNWSWKYILEYIYIRIYMFKDKVCRIWRWRRNAIVWMINHLVHELLIFTPLKRSCSIMRSVWLMIIGYRLSFLFFFSLLSCASFFLIQRPTTCPRSINPVITMIANNEFILREEEEKEKKEKKERITGTCRSMCFLLTADFFVFFFFFRSF